MVITMFELDVQFSNQPQSKIESTRETLSFVAIHKAFGLWFTDSKSACTGTVSKLPHNPVV